MLGVIVNTVSVTVGSLLGLFAKKNIPQKMGDSIMKGMALCTMYIGIDGALKGENTLVLIISIVIGAFIGELIDIDAKIQNFSTSIEQKYSKKQGLKTSLTEGFLTASLLFCIGSMTIVGSLQSGLQGNHDMIFTKSIMDFIAAIILSSTLGIGVLLSSIFVFLFQGSLVLLAGIVAPLFTSYVIAEMTCVGSVLVFGLGFNLLGVTKLKCANYLPAIFLPIILCMFM